MDEIKDICKKEKLNYIVSDLSFAYIKRHKKFEDEQCYFNIMMPLKDALKLEKYVNKNLSESRVVESWNNNPDLQMLKFHYVDKTTLFFDGGSPEKRKHKGIYITILPTRQFEPSNDVRGIERYIQLLNYKQERFVKWIVLFKLATRITHINLFKRYIMRYVKLENANYIHHGYLNRKKMTKEEMINYVINANVKATKPFTTLRFMPEDQITESTEGEKCLAYMDERSKVVKLPIDLYKDIDEVEFEGKTFNVYKDEEVYFETMYGIDWKIKITDEILGSDRSTVFYDTEIPYTEYLDYIKDDETTLEDITDSKLAYNYWMGQVHNPAVEKAWHTFMMARRGVERIDTWYRLRNKRDDLKEAYENNDLPKLKKLMKGYIKNTDKYLAEKIGFYIDDELFKYAEVIWEDEGRPERTDKDGNKITFAQYVYSFVPDLYKSETPDEYFEKRNKTFE